MKLYWFPGSCSLAVHIALREVGQSFDLVRVDMGSKEMENGGSYLAVNPRGALPALQLDDGSILTEAAVLMQYVADHAPDAKLLPPVGTLQRYQQLEWLNHLASDVHKAFSALFNPAAPDAFKGAVKQQIERYFAGIDSALSDRDWLSGAYGIADIYAFVVTGWAGFGGIDLLAYPALSEWRSRITARPGVGQALAAEGLA